MRPESKHPPTMKMCSWDKHHFSDICDRATLCLVTPSTTPTQWQEGWTVHQAAFRHSSRRISHAQVAIGVLVSQRGKTTRQRNSVIPESIHWATNSKMQELLPLFTYYIITVLRKSDFSGFQVLNPGRARFVTLWKSTTRGQLLPRHVRAGAGGSTDNYTKTHTVPEAGPGLSNPQHGFGLWVGLSAFQGSSLLRWQHSNAFPQSSKSHLQKSQGHSS